MMVTGKSQKHIPLKLPGVAFTINTLQKQFFLDSNHCSDDGSVLGEDEYYPDVVMTISKLKSVISLMA